MTTPRNMCTIVFLALRLFCFVAQQNADAAPLTPCVDRPECGRGVLCSAPLYDVGYRTSREMKYFCMKKCNLCVDVARPGQIISKSPDPQDKAERIVTCSFRSVFRIINPRVYHVLLYIKEEVVRNKLLVDDEKCLYSIGTNKGDCTDREQDGSRRFKKEDFSSVNTLTSNGVRDAKIILTIRNATLLALLDTSVFRCIFSYKDPSNRNVRKRIEEQLVLNPTTVTEEPTTTATTTTPTTSTTTPPTTTTEKMPVRTIIIVNVVCWTALALVVIYIYVTRCDDKRKRKEKKKKPESPKSRKSKRTRKSSSETESS